MAEGLLRARYGDRYEAISAGTERAFVRPLALRAMEEIGIDLSGHTSKAIADLGERSFDVVVSVCDSAREACPFVPARRTLHQSFRDPATAAGSPAEQLAVYREVRDALAAWIDETFGDAEPFS